jgi:16S rRNA C967 or C1407 C5-methylase (RsmB/RsmF family)
MGPTGKTESFLQCIRNDHEDVDITKERLEKLMEEVKKMAHPGIVWAPPKCCGIVNYVSFKL